MDISVEKYKINDKNESSLAVRLHAPPMLNFIIVKKFIDSSRLTLSIPGCIVDLDGAKSILQTLARAIEEAELLRIT